MDSDYHIASLLQEEFENEGSIIDNDYQVALLVQEQYNNEINVENPKDNLVYDSKTRKGDRNSSKSLVDPSWELIDPTPDIHTLFVAFNERFFWNKLLSVCVSWSKRMTRCAGVCSYSGRGGMCQITLSEPLLKLRPRKDLVETLLHEMIHAYLFVTHNNKDRSGHGPEFHKHMYRINAESGTNITVYHDFHDEVKVYQQHWWRCNGPCQNKRPFFGIVRRSTNRAPGPNDRWWAEHMATCGGTFIKVKEPQTNTGTKSVSKVNNVNGDIKKYLPKSKEIKSGEENTFQIQAVNSYSKLNDTGKIGTSKMQPSNTNSNIHGFVNLRNTFSEAMIKNNSSTVVVNKKVMPVSPSVFSKPKTEKIVLPSSSPSGNSLPSSAFNVTRNHWAKKYNIKDPPKIGDTSGIKRPPSEGDEFGVKSQKIMKGEFSSQHHIEYVVCPICNTKISLKESDVHIDSCVNKDHEFEECIICGTLIEKSHHDEHTRKCLNENFKDDFTKDDHVLENKGTKKCNICCEIVNEYIFTTHIAECRRKKQNILVDLTDEEISEKECPVCDKNIASSVFENHVETCLHSFYDNMEKMYSNSQTTKCLSCNKDILKSELNSHLEVCMVDVFKGDIGDCDQDKYNCPFCMNLFYEAEMSYHIAQCLKSSESEMMESQSNKKDLLNCLLSEDEF